MSFIEPTLEVPPGVCTRKVMISLPVEFASGRMMRVPPKLVELLAGTMEEAVDAHTIQPYYTVLLADESGMQVEDIGAPIALVTFPARLLDRPIPCADAQLARTLRPLWMEELATLQDRNDKLHELQTAILPLLPRGTPTPPHVAAVLGISTRALQAELDNLGTDLPAMVDSVRRVLCSRILARGQTSLVQAARILGFTDVEAFVDAHQRWWASPPCDGRGRLLH